MPPKLTVFYLSKGSAYRFQFGLSRYFPVVGVLCLFIWKDTKPIVWDSSVVFTDNSDLVDLRLTRFLLNNFKAVSNKLCNSKCPDDILFGVTSKNV